jgi:TetR/AcrR family transcriptional regulator, transcriptional repressor for nem operon
VSVAHRDDPASGCGVVALGTDMPRVGGPAQEAYRAQVERYLAHLQPLLGGDDDARRRATVTLSAMVGAVMIARALGPTSGSDEILRDVREAVRERRLL